MSLFTNFYLQGGRDGREGICACMSLGLSVCGTEWGERRDRKREKREKRDGRKKAEMSLGCWVSGERGERERGKSGRIRELIVAAHLFQIITFFSHLLFFSIL